MDFKKILNEVGLTAATAVGAQLVSSVIGGVSNNRVQVVRKCSLHTPLSLCMDKKCFYHAVDKQRLGLR